MTFASYHWPEPEWQDESLAGAYRQLHAGSSADALQTLLRSSDMAAQCIAMDHYAYAESRGRYGERNPYATLADEVRARAREQLGLPPIEASDATAMAAPGARQGANHASALIALAHLARPEDAQSIAAALSMAMRYDPPNREILFNGVMAAQAALIGASPPAPALMHVLRALIFDDRLPVDLRAAAISALAESRTAEAASILVDATYLHDLRLQATAAWSLADDLKAHRARVEELVAAWPDDAPYPASEVIASLTGAEDGDET